MASVPEPKVATNGNGKEDKGNIDDERAKDDKSKTPEAPKSPIQVQKEEKKAERSKSAVSEKALSVDKEVAHFGQGGGRSEHMVVNTGDHRIAVKIRSSNNKQYRVEPVHMFIEQGQAQLLVITRTPGGPNKQDKLVLQFTHVDKDATNPKTCFTDKTKIEGQIRILLKVVSPEELAALTLGGTAADLAHDSAKSTPGEAKNRRRPNASREAC